MNTPDNSPKSDADYARRQKVLTRMELEAALASPAGADKVTGIVVTTEYLAGVNAALRAIAAIPMAGTEEQTNGHEDAYRAVEALATPEQPAKPFNAPGLWFPIGVLGHPLREYAPGKWESATWPSEQPGSSVQGEAVAYRCERARIVGWWNCGCEECAKRKSINTITTPPPAPYVLVSTAGHVRDGIMSPAPAAEQAGVIKLTPAEIQSGFDRVRWAEGLIRQLPADHDGRNSWLVNYGTSAGLIAAAPAAEQGDTDGADRARKLYEPDDYEDAFKGRNQPEARGVEGMVECAYCTKHIPAAANPVRASQPEGKGAVRLAGFTQYHLDNWTDDDFKQHIPAVREALAEALAAAPAAPAVGADAPVISYKGFENAKDTGGSAFPCEGACEPHVGEVIAVTVDGWGSFDYCQTAIAEDRRRGLIVTPIAALAGKAGA